MTTNRTRSSIKSKSSKFREVVTLMMRAGGLPVTRRTEVYRHALAASGPRLKSDILGLDRWAIRTFSEAFRRDFSGGLDDAVAAAAHDSKALAAGIWHRPDRDIEEAYVVMRLSDFMRVLADEQARDA